MSVNNNHNHNQNYEHNNNNHNIINNKVSSQQQQQQKYPRNDVDVIYEDILSDDIVNGINDDVVDNLNDASDDGNDANGNEDEDGNLDRSSPEYPLASPDTYDVRQRTIENIWDITVSLNILYKENWTK